MSNESSWLIRRGRTDETELLLAFWRTAEATPSVTDTEPDIQQVMTAKSELVLLAEMDGRIAGSIIGTFDGWRGHIYRLAVLPDYRRRGLALALVRRIEAWLTEQGARRIIPLVEKDHPDAMGFWKAAGYTYDPRIVRHFKNL